MPSLQIFDRLNVANTGSEAVAIRSMPIKRYFGEMRLTKRQKTERINLANDIEDAMLFFFSLVILQRELAFMAGISAVDIKEQFRTRMEETVSKHTELTADIRQHINEYVDDVTKSTTEHLEILLALMEDAEPETKKNTEKRKAEEFYLSDDRARLLGEEESNTIFNMSDFEKAKLLGYKHKTWLTMRDSRVRKTHVPLDDKTISIDEFFIVGESLMRYPRDEFGSDKETIGCRCSIRYSK